jgi:hypothetical protein
MRRVLLGLVAALAAGPMARAQSGWVAPPPELGAIAPDMGDSQPVFDDEFDQLDVGCFSFQGSAGPHRWYIQSNASAGGGVAISPCHSQVSVADGVLNITLANQGGKWVTGELAGMNGGGDGQGFRPPFYVEARIRLPSQVPPGLDVWPAFWMNGRWSLPGTGHPYSEFDILEAWGQSHPTAAITLHLWPARPAEATTPVHTARSMPGSFSPFDDQWHTYALLVDSARACTYFDKVQQGCIPTAGLPLDAPLYPMLTLGLKGPVTADPSATYTMQVDYVRIWAPPQG